jgi:hypothetical protein
MESYSEVGISYFYDSLKLRTQAISNFRSLERAAQYFVEEIFSDFDSSVLVRLYTTIPYGKLPPPPRAFVDQIARSAGVTDQVNDDTPALCLMGTKGKRAEWCDRLKSRGHLAIPLVSRKFVHNIPMITRLLNEFGIGTDWLDQPDKTSIIIRSLGRIATVFYVPDATTFRDHANRLVVPATDFVAQYNVKTVFGVGGAYANGYVCTILFFVSERLERSVVDRFLPIINFFKQATTPAVLDGRLFA